MTIGRARVVLAGDQKALAERLTAAGVVLVDPGTLTDRTAETVMAGSALVVVSTGTARAPIHHWVNRATLRGDVTSLHATADGDRAVLGPLVRPGAPPCYLCWRMRALACADDFEVAMAREERADDSPAADLPTRAVDLLAREVLAVALGRGTPRLAGTVVTMDALGRHERAHRLLPRPDCPDCGAPPDRDLPPPLGSLLAETPSGPLIDRITDAVVSPVCGLVRSLGPAPRRPEDPDLPVLVRARLANAQFAPVPLPIEVCGGRGPDRETAVAGALAECLERHAALTWAPGRRVHAARRELDGPSLDPCELVLHAPHQYPELPFAPYHDATALDWVPARSLRTGDQVWVPLLAAHVGFRPPEAEHLFRATTSGFAAGRTLTEAVLRAALEVVERHAFLLAWLHSRPGERTPAAEVPDEPTRAVAAAYACRQVRIDVHRLPTDTVPVVLAVAWGDGPPRAVIGLGADLDPVIAARRAVYEVAQVRTSLRVSLSRPATAARLAGLAAHPEWVSDPSDHALRFADPATADAGLAHLAAAPLAPWADEPRPPAHPGEQLREVVTRLVAAAGDVLYLDVTPADVAGLGVAVARVIVPGFQPLHFGAAEARLGAAPAGRLNLAPHPLG